jgi:hypothetical protein
VGGLRHDCPSAFRGRGASFVRVLSSQKWERPRPPAYQTLPGSPAPCPQLDPTAVLLACMAALPAGRCSRGQPLDEEVDQ